MLKLNLQALKEEMMGDLNRYNIHILREKGSKLGIKSVTTHNKERLIELIIEKKLKNQKSYEVENVLESNTEISLLDKERLLEIHADSENEECEMVSGLLDIIEGIDGFLRIYPHKQSDEDIFVPQAIINEYKLKYGDRILGKAVKLQESDWRGLVDITSVNGHKPPIRRMDFQSFTPCEAREPISFWDSEDTLLKRIDIFAPIAKGGRSMVFCSLPINITSIINDMVISLNKCGIMTKILCLSEKPEIAASLSKQFRDSVISTENDATDKNNERVAQLTLESLKREAEMGKSVALIVSNMITLGAGEKRYILEREFNYKTLFTSARNLEGGGSLTIIGFSFLLGQTGESIYESLVPLANSVSVLTPNDDAHGGVVYDINKGYSDFFEFDTRAKEIASIIKSFVKKYSGKYDEAEMFKLYHSLKKSREH